MAKSAVTYNGAVFGSHGSNGTLTPVFTPAQNPDHTAVKDTRT